ncbi:MAG: HAD-IA family hydrolase [Candidatus Thermoplasmatota archaeon]
MKPDAILFDMDGVLVDSLESWWSALNDALENYGYDKVSREEFKDRFWGHDLRSNLEKFDIDKKVVSFCNNVYSEHIDKVKVFSDTKKTLGSLDSFKKALITNTPNGCTNQILDITGLKKFFDVIITSDHVGMGKPDPEMIFKACSELDVKPENCLLVGDTDSDVKAGHAAGCKVVGIKIDADYRVEKLSDFKNILEL